jgi:hypothetical protein
MNMSHFLRRPSLAAFLGAAVILSSSSGARAQVPADALKMAGDIALTKDLMSHMQAFVKKVTEDAAVKAEFLKMNEDPEMTEQMPDAVISKYPKVTGAFKSSMVKPDEFFKAWSAMMIVPALIAAGTPLENKTAQANVEFFKANKEEVLALSQSIATLEKASASPSASP